MKQNAYDILKDNVHSHWWNISKDKIVKSVIEQLNLEDRSAVLELGVGTGFFLSNLRYNNKTGIDYYDYQDKFKGYRHIRGNVTDLPFKNKTFDLILAIDLVEHIEDDLGLIKNCVSHLKKNGYLIIFVPAFNFLWSDLDVIGKHFRRYNSKMFNKIFDQLHNKVKVVKKTYLNFFLFPYIGLIRLIQKRVKSINKEYDSSSIRKPNKIINFLLQKIFSSERFLINWVNLPFGSSYLVVLRKN